MYSTCLFCNARLGANEAIEHFPVGRRLAFDAAKGRLWVVCRACERWNLSPLEERWEAIEECERRFADTRMRVSTDNVGLAKLREGLELVRIGEPRRPEFAAWRYGDQFGRRRRLNVVKAGLGLGAFGLVLAGGAAAGVGIGSFAWFLWQAGERIVKGNPETTVARLPLDEGRHHEVRRERLGRVKLFAGDDARSWLLSVPKGKRSIDFRGEAAVRAAGLLLPPMNRFGGSRAQVGEAVELLERSREPAGFFRDAVTMHAGRSEASVAKLPHPVRLALEMAAHEEAERRALEGELAALERAWRDAEEIAAISDTLLVPQTVQHWLEKLRGA